MDTQEMYESLKACIENVEALVAALIATHPDPASVRDEWRRTMASASADLLLDDVASGRSSTYRKQTNVEIARWDDVLAGICQRARDAGT